ncbi:hypothetical protein V5O48_010979 [Marasmius crinis-equi]|uniref:PPPDE domain-containing protein n=1 Tax=Marasmius crinis-equi TaxID=585013 RepID=A0ABR3F6V8_9AGAR
MPSQPTPTRWSLVGLVGRLFSRFMAPFGNTHARSEPLGSPYAVCHCLKLPHAQSILLEMFGSMVQEKDLKCIIRAIALCKRTDGFQHETLIAIISLPGQPDALVFLERAGSWYDWSLQTYLHSSAEVSTYSLPLGDPSQPQTSHHERMAKDIITLLPKSSLYWRYPKSHDRSNLPFHELPHIIKKSSTSSPSPDTLVDEVEQTESARVTGEGMARPQGEPLQSFKGSRRQRDVSEDQPSANSEADHAFIYAIVFPEGDSNPPTVLDLAIASRVVSEHRPDYSLMRNNCYFFAAAICKTMERQFGGKKIWNQDFHESQPPPRDVDDPPNSANLKAGGLRPLQILRDDRVRFTTMVDALVTRFEEERKTHPVMASRETREELRREVTTNNKLQAELREKDAALKAKDAELQQLRQQLASSASASTSYH